MIYPESFEQLCLPLLEVDKSMDPRNPTIKLTHRTAGEFLRQPANKIEGLLPEHGLNDFFGERDDKRHLDMATACVTYLSFLTHAAMVDEDLEKKIQTNDPQYAFLKYASIFWRDHLNQVDPDK